MGRSKLHRQYYDQKSVGSYGGVAALQRVVPAERDVERWLSTQDAYTLHKPVRRRFKRRCVVVGGPNQQWQADLVDMSRLKQANNEITFLLTVIDVFSKRAWCIPLKRKSAAALVTAFTPLLNNRAPTTLQTDKGSEFLNRPLFHEEPDAPLRRCAAGFRALIQQHLSSEYWYGPIGGEWCKSGNGVATVVRPRRGWYAQVSSW